MLKGYKTLIVNIALAIVGVLIATDFTGIGLSTETSGLIISGLGAVNVVLRFLTTTPVGQK